MEQQGLLGRSWRSAMPEKSGFTLAVLPHNGKKGRQYDVSGWKLALFRAVVILLVAFVVGSVVTIAFGLTRTAGMTSLAREVSVLQDSLDKMTDFGIRLGNIQREIEEIREARSVIENLSTMTLDPDSL
jgi:hypothetical protein